MTPARAAPYVTTVKAKPLLFSAVTLALAGCASTGSAVPSGVTVPTVRGHTIEQAYALLRSKGFRVSFNTPFVLQTYLPDGVSKAIPSAGTRVARGSIVTLVPMYGPSGSPVYGNQPPKYYRLPDFTGRSLAVAKRWLDRRHLGYSRMQFAPLTGSTAPSLFAAYVVETQRPAAGRRLSEDGWLLLTLRPRR